MDPRTLASAALAYHLVQGALSEMRSSRDKIKDALAALPVVRKEELVGVDLEEPCPICLVPFSTVFAEQEWASEDRKSAEHTEEVVVGEEDIGVTRLEQCGHVFCRRDLTEWIRSQHGSCPTCRHTFIHLQPLSTQSDDEESSDGGEYVPNLEELDDEDEDTFIDADALTDIDIDEVPHEMSVQFDRVWDDEAPLEAETEVTMSEVDVDGDSMMGEADTEGDDDEYDDEENISGWGLTDGESSMTSSEAGDMHYTLPGDELENEASTKVLDREVSVSVHEDEDANAKEGEGISADGNASSLDVAQQDKETPTS